jgi:uncharacterized protein
MGINVAGRRYVLGSWFGILPHKVLKNRPDTQPTPIEEMKLTDHRPNAAVLVRAYSPGELRVGETVLHRSCLLRADRMVTDWRPQTLGELTLADMEAVFALDPEVIVLGSGPRQRFPDSALYAALLSRGIGCEVMDTGAACRTYNVLVSEDRRVVAALLLHDD